MIDRSTKICELTVHLITGVRISGTFHVPISTGSAIRPSDAVLDCKGGFILLSDATVNDADGTRNHPAIMIRLDSVAHIELPPKGWSNRPSGEPAAAAPAATPPSPRRPLNVSIPPVPVRKV
ncbi:MAG: hypothetical protein HY763_12595 [Planctomycetes bacterium]|nr:hypothetical protein [Planctomycetota bacterium]